MALQLDTLRPFRSRSQVEQLLRAVLAADPADEPEWLEWKSRLDLSKRSRVLMVAKEVLGLANRSVEKASRFCEGVGYVVVGAAANGELLGVEEVDLATVEQMLDSYVGSGKDAPTYLCHGLPRHRREAGAADHGRSPPAR